MGGKQEKPDNSAEPEATPSGRLADLLKQIRRENDKRDREAPEKRRKAPKDGAGAPGKPDGPRRNTQVVAADSLALAGEVLASTPEPARD
jgi:hypothetical protein